MSFCQLNEAIENFIGYTIYCDMDGVLVDLEKSVRSALGKKERLDRVSIVRGLSRLVSQGVPMDDFFESLEWTEDGERLWSYLLPYEPVVLTGGNESNPIADGKNAWCRKNLGISSDRIIHDHLKERYAGPNCILIDDWPRNTKHFDDYGGLSILHQSATHTIGRLKSLIKRRR